MKQIYHVILTPRTPNSPFFMSHVWVQFKQFEPVEVSTDGRRNLSAFKEAIKEKLSSKLGSYDVDSVQ